MAREKRPAAFGTAFRALGHGMRVGMIQFIKGNWKTGERKLGEQTPNLTWLTMGHGFTWESLDPTWIVIGQPPGLHGVPPALGFWKIATTW